MDSNIMYKNYHIQRWFRTYVYRSKQQNRTMDLC